MAKIRVCIAPRLVKAQMVAEFEENKKADFPCDYLIIYQKSPSQDDSGETLYNLAVYKQIEGYPIRGKESLKEILTFFKKHNSKKRPHHIQILDADAYEQKQK